MPFADYEDFEACERANSDKRDPGAYCGALKRATEEAGVDDPNVEHLSQLETSAEALDELCQARPEWERYDLGNATAWIGQQSGATVYQEAEADPPELDDAVVVQGLSDEAREALESRYNVDVVEFFQDVPDDAVSISDRDEAPEGASIITGPRGGLYYVPGGGDSDDGDGDGGDYATEEASVSEATGVPEESVRLDGLDGSVVEQATPALESAGERGWTDNVEQITTDAEEHGMDEVMDEAIAAYSPTNGSLYFNPDSFTEETANLYGEEGAIAVGSVEGMVNHELGHARHYEIGINDANILGSFDALPQVAEAGIRPEMPDEYADMTGDEFAGIAGNVSDMAASSGNEFVAEVHAGLAAGEEYDDEVMELYEAVGGPEVEQ